MYRMFDFECTACGETFEEMIDKDQKSIPCPECQGTAKRQLAAPRADWRKMGLDPGFPGAYEKWGKAKRVHHETGKKDRYEGGANLRMY